MISMNIFLQSLKADLNGNELGERNVWLILGNEACDLDSVVSSLAYAYHKQKKVSPNDLVIPLCNVTREDVSLRAETLYWLSHSVGISPDDLFYADTTFQYLRDSKHTFKVVLIDHNFPAEKDKWISDHVVAIIDHHNISQHALPLHNSCQSVTIQPTGSCASLVTQICWPDHQDLPQHLFQMLYGAIIQDTVCLSESVGRVTPTDISMAEKIESLLNITLEQRQKIFHDLQAAKFSAQGLSILDILRRDVKFSTFGDLKIGVSTMLGITYNEITSRPEFEEHLSKWNEKVVQDANVLLTSMQGIILVSSSPDFLDSLAVSLSSGLPLEELSSVTHPDFHIRVFHQLSSPPKSRKVILPLVDAFLETQTQLNASADVHRIVTPSNSYSSSPVEDAGFNLPSFNNRRTVDLVNKKRQESFPDEVDDDLDAAIDAIVEVEDGPSSPHLYTPANSSSDEELVVVVGEEQRSSHHSLIFDSSESRRVHNLPSLNNRETLAKVQEKRRRHQAMTGDGEGCSPTNGCSESEADGEKSPYTPSNSYTEETPAELKAREEGVQDKNEGSLEERVRQKRDKLIASTSQDDEDEDESTVELLLAEESEVDISIGTDSNLHHKNKTTSRDHVVQSSTSVNSEGSKKKIFPSQPIRFDVSNLESLSRSDSLDDLDGMLTPDLDGLSTPVMDQYLVVDRCQTAYGTSKTASNKEMVVRAASGTSWWKIQAPPPDIILIPTPFPLSSLPEYSMDEEAEDARRYRNIYITGKVHTIDMLSIRPYMKLISHCGFYVDASNENKSTSLVAMSLCHLPKRSAHNYDRIMESLFSHIIHILETLSTNDYTIVFFQGGGSKDQLPHMKWLKDYYSTIDTKLKKSLKHLYLVHPNFLVKTMVYLSKFFISSKFKSKVVYVNSLTQLSTYVPTQFISIPSRVLLYDQQNASQSQE